MELIELLNDLLWSNKILYLLLGLGLYISIRSKGVQFKSLKYGTKLLWSPNTNLDSPGVLSHFQALTTALSATVGLGNIAGVAIAISLGGPGAVFWMWAVGFLGMALKFMEVLQSMIFRNIDSSGTPHGGPMWVSVNGLSKFGFKKTGKVIAVIFCITLIVSTITGGNMFQVWSVADITRSYFNIPTIFTGICFFILTAIIIIGGIKRIGKATEFLVPIMCIIYILAGLWVLISNFEKIPDLLILIVKSGLPEFLGGKSFKAEGAFLGATVGTAFLKGMQRSLFSNEAGQGSSPIAHSASKTNYPASEALVAGLEPFVDTLLICTMTAMIILSSGVWNRKPELKLIKNNGGIGNYKLLGNTDINEINVGDMVFSIAENPMEVGSSKKITGQVKFFDGEFLGIAWNDLITNNKFKLSEFPKEAFFSYTGATLTAKSFDNTLNGLGKWIVTITVWLFALSTIISWSYYGEQGIEYLFNGKFITTYRWIYCLCLLIATSGFINSEQELDIVSSLGTGLMLWVNVPLMIIFINLSLKYYWTYLEFIKNNK